AELVRDHLPPGVSLRDLGEHRLRDLVRPERVFQLMIDGVASEFPMLRSLGTVPNNLPRQPPTFIGREREVGQANRPLSATDLLTLTGSGGVGKTRLALQVAADLLHDYSDGVWLVELAALAEGALVPNTVALALGVREQPEIPLTQSLAAHLRPRQLLLV